MSTPPSPSSPRAIFACGALIALATLAAYANSLGGPFVYDDGPAIADNVTLRHFTSALFPPPGTTVSGRPIVNLSFALNYAISGSHGWSYHALNILIHLAAGLALFGVVRRTLSALNSQRSTSTAFAVALLWSLHPLQTEAVTYVVQRAESLMGLCYLLTLYGFVRAMQSPTPRRWSGVSFLACLGGMASKEVMVSAPLMVLLFDRTFFSGSFRRAFAQRKNFYLTLASTWLLLAALVASTGGDRGGTFVLDLAAAWSFWLTQFRAITHYLVLSFWPAPLIFEYGTFWEKGCRRHRR